MPLSKYRYIVVEGSHWRGQDQLGQAPGGAHRAQMLLEKPQENPFLARFYEDTATLRPATQLFFLVPAQSMRCVILAQMDMFSIRTVSDYLFEKDGCSRG